MQLIRLV